MFNRYKIIFWDFDGVIKESVEVKTKAFQDLFCSFGEEVVAKVTAHHKDNGGMSRFKKIPVYLAYAGVETSPVIEEDYCNRFGELVEDAVVGADWVQGVEKIIKQKTNENLRYILVTATPQNEIERILNRLSIGDCFSNIFGAPMSKSDAIHRGLALYEVNPKETLMIGDSKADYEAAQYCGTDFLLRRTAENFVSMPDYLGVSVNNFVDYAKQTL
jgi:phosphoglycolate phosphatase-like HAD superfamily hydrolase